MNLVATPWDNSVGKSAKKRVIAVALLFFAVITMSGLFATASAKAHGVQQTMIMAQGTPGGTTSTCQRVIFAGDRHAGGIQETIGDSDDIEYAVNAGTDLTQVRDNLQTMNITSQDCVYIDAGILDASQLNSGDLTEEQIRERIQDILEITGNARNVVWITPVVADTFPENSPLERSEWDPSSFNDILKEEVNKQGNARVADITGLGSEGELFSDGVTMTDDGYARRLAELLESANNGDTDAQVSLSALVSILEEEGLLDAILDLIGLDEDDLNLIDDTTENETPIDTDTPTDNDTPTPPTTTTGGGNTGGGNTGGGNTGGGNTGGGNTGGGNTGGGGLPTIPGIPDLGGSNNHGPSGATSDNVNRFLRPGAESQIGGQIASSNDAVNRGPTAGDAPAGDISVSSPRGFAQKIARSSDFAYLNRYLSVHRWQSFSVPAPSQNPLTGGSPLGAMMASLTQFMLVTFASVSAAILGFLTICFSPLFGSVFLSWGDNLFGTVIGGIFSGSVAGFGMGTGADSAAASAALLSALVVTALVTSAMSAFSAENAGKSIRERGMSIVVAVLKVMSFFIVIGGVGIQSSKNHNTSTDDALSQIVQQIEDRSLFSAGDDSAGISLDGAGGINTDYKTKEVKTMALTDVNSWEPLSMGWIVTVILDIANMLINAILGVANAIVLYPISAMASKMDNATNGGAGLEAPRPACARYIDSMHFAYLNSAAGNSSPIFAQIMAGMDKVYYRTVLAAYAQGFGDTLSGNNVWCHVLENDNGAASGDRLMLGRTSGLWTEVAGAGNLIAGSPPMVTTGQNSIGPKDANTTSGPHGIGGVLVTSSGDWASIGSDGNQAPVRADVYFGMSSIDSDLEDDNPTKAADTAVYYFAACEWNPRKVTAVNPRGGTTLNREWRGIVLAMPSADPDFENTNNHITHSEFMEGGHGDEMETKTISSAHSLAGPVFKQYESLWQNGDDDNNASKYLHDVDCIAYQNFPVGAEGEHSNKYGWGSNNRITDRWYFAPQNSNLMATVAARASTSNNPYIRTVSWMATQAADAVTDGEASREVAKAKRNIAAQDAFSGSEIPETGRNYAFEFWRAMNGQGETGKVLGSVYLSGAAFYAIAFFMLPTALFGLIVNLIFGLILLFIPAFVMINLLMRTIKGGK